MRGVHLVDDRNHLRAILSGLTPRCFPLEVIRRLDLAVVGAYENALENRSGEHEGCPIVPQVPLTVHTHGRVVSPIVKALVERCIHCGRGVFF